MKIAKSDPYMSFYGAHQALHPDDDITLKVYTQRDVDAVDKLLELSKGNREEIRTEEDWNVLANLVVFYIQRWANEWMEFRQTMPDIKETRRKGGYSKSKEIKYVGAMPPRLMKLIKIIFPYQQYDKKFMYEFIRRFQVFQVGGKN